jgi:phosphotransacetylase
MMHGMNFVRGALNFWEDWHRLAAGENPTGAEAVQVGRDVAVTPGKVVETVSTKIRSTLDAAALCKMADRGQIFGAVIDGSLAFDNAVSAEAAKTKGIVSPVAGQADIFVVPNVEAGNLLAKQLEYLAEAEIAGIVLAKRTQDRSGAQ